MSRSYYAIFAVATGALIRQGATPRAALRTWSHEQLPDVLLEQLRRALPVSLLREIRTLVRRARNLREMADYYPFVTVDQETARRAVRYATTVVRALKGNQ